MPDVTIPVDTLRHAGAALGRIEHYGARALVNVSTQELAAMALLLRVAGCPAIRPDETPDPTRLAAQREGFLERISPRPDGPPPHAEEA
ncbi:MAG: hypothetical protein ACU0CO_01315 [Shimia sp.]